MALGFNEQQTTAARHMRDPVPHGAPAWPPASLLGTLPGQLGELADVSTLRALPDDLAAGAFPAWEVAREHIHARWTEATDPANLQPRVPKPMRDAAALITRTAPPGMTRVEADELINRLNGNYNLRIQAVFRGILRSDADETEKARLIAEQADEFGLEAAPPPEPLPAITTEDVNLVCWLAVSPA